MDPDRDPGPDPGQPTPTVVAIHVAKGRRLPTRSVPSVEAEAGAGLVGDRYHGSRHRHVTVQSLPELEVVRIAAPCRLLDDNLGPGAARALHARAGTVFRLLSSGTISVGDEVDLSPGH